MWKSKNYILSPTNLSNNSHDDLHVVLTKIKKTNRYAIAVLGTMGPLITVKQDMSL